MHEPSRRARRGQRRPSRNQSSMRRCARRQPVRSALGGQRAFPTRREGPAKLTGTAQYTDDLVFPGAWYGAHHPLDRAARAAARRRPRSGLRLVEVVVMTAKDIPGDEPRLAHPRRPAGPRQRRDPASRRAGRPARRAGPRHAARGARGTSRCATEPLPPVFDPLAVGRRSSPRIELDEGDVDAALRARPTSSSRASTASATRSSCTSRTTR